MIRGDVSKATLRTLVRGLFGALLTGLCAAPAIAATTTTTFGVSATVLSACIVTATPLAFGNYTASAGSPTDANSTVTATCTSGVSYSIALNGGTTTGGTVAARLMANGSNTLGYGLYTTNGYSTIWGDGTLTTSTVGPNTATGLPQNYTVYGQIPTGQYVAAGAYTDTITVTVNY
jgi:spore coat protein U-like protein